MSQINFLPETFQRERRRERRRPIEFLLIAATLLALVGLWLSTSGPDSALARQCVLLDQDLAEIAELQAEQDRLFRERSELQRRLMTARETYQPISKTQVISRISRLTPEPIRLVNVEVSAQRPEAQPLPTPGDKKKVTGKKSGEKPVEPNLMKITITGHAPSDKEIVTLIRRMDRDPVFSSVALRSSKQDQTRTHFVRTFHLDVLIDLDRRFVDSGGDPDAD